MLCPMVSRDLRETDSKERSRPGTGFWVPGLLRVNLFFCYAAEP